MIIYKVNANITAKDNTAYYSFSMASSINDGNGHRVGSYIRTFGYNYADKTVGIGTCKRSYVNGSDTKNDWIIPQLLFGIK